MKNKKNKKNKMFLIILILSLLFILGVIVYFDKVHGIISDALTYDDNRSSTYSQAEVDDMLKEAEKKGRDSLLDEIRSAIEGGGDLLSVLKGLYPDHLIVASNGRYNWVEINPDLKMHSYDNDGISKDEKTKEITYSKNGKVVSVKGIDVSSHQGDIDWELVKKDGVEFAFVRACYRGYGTGKLVVDTKCIENLQNAKAAGIKVGVYVFSQAVTKDEAIEEADTVLCTLDGMKLDLPIVYDVEKLPNKTARMNALSVQGRTDIAIAFLEEIKSFNYDCMLYHNTEMGAMLFDMTRLEEYDKWFAAYSDEIYWPYQFEVWQYCEKGRVAGIDGYVDLDVWMSEFE